MAMRNFILPVRRGFILCFFCFITNLFLLSSILVPSLSVFGSSLQTKKPLLLLSEKVTKKDKDCSNEDNMTMANIRGANFLVYQSKSRSASNDQVITVKKSSEENRPFAATAKKGSISGYAVDDDGVPIETVKINLKGEKTKIKRTTYSNIEGFFEFIKLKKDTYVITTEKSGYNKSEQKIKLEKGEEKEITIELKIPAEISSTIGPSGGVIEVADLSSPLYGAKVEIPDGALEQETNITVFVFSKSDLEQKIGQSLDEIRYFGGIKINAGSAVLKKAMSVSLPNSFGATSNDQLLVAQAADIDGKAHSEVVYKGVANIDSLLMFNTSDFGSFGVLSPTDPLGLISGTFLNQSDSQINDGVMANSNLNLTSIPVSNGVIATSFSKPFTALTDATGYFEIPAAPAGNYATIIGVPPSDFTMDLPSLTGGIGMEEVKIPNILPTPPTSIVDAITKIITNEISDKLGMEEDPPPTCVCDVSSSSLVFSTSEDAEPPFELFKGQTVQFYMTGLSGVYGGTAPTLSTLPLDIIQNFWDGTLCVASSVSFSTDDSSIAKVETQTGKLTAKSKGETWLSGRVEIVCNKRCDDGSPRTCYYSLQAVSAKVVVGDCSIYVDAVKGDDLTGDGSQEKPFKTITKGTSIAKDGCTIAVAEGTYNEYFSINNLNITIQGAGVGKSIVNSYDGISYGGITANNSNINISGFSFTESNGILLSNSEAIINSNEFYDCVGGCITLNDNSNATIEFNQLHNTLGYGIAVTDNSKTTISSNEIYENSSDGITLQYNNSAVIITSNKIYSNGGSGISVLYNSSSTTIASNEIHDHNRHWGIFLSGNSAAEITTNELYNNLSDILLYNNSTAIIEENILISDIGIYNMSKETIDAAGNSFENDTEYEIDKYDIYDHGYWDKKKEKYTVRCEECGEVNF